MSPADAAKLLDLPSDATPEQLEARFLELRRKLEEKIAKAPTPGLQAKYRESLADITTAFETLTLAADSSSLPVTSKQTAGGPASLPAAPESDSSGLRSQVSLPGDGPDKHRDGSSQQRRGIPAAKRKSGGREFALVAVIAVLVLAAGGWFIMKSRAENAENARLAKAESERVNALKTSLRAKLAEARVDWEAHESELQDAERRANELKSELRGLRDAPAARKAELSAQVTAQELYAKWLKSHLLRHPAKLARVRAEELLQAGAQDEAATVVDEITTALTQLAGDVASRRTYFFDASTDLRLNSTPEGVSWFLTDAYGRTQEGVTPAQLQGLPLTHLVTDGLPVAPFAGTEKRGEFTTGKISVVFLRTGWPEVVRETTALSQDNPVLQAEFPEGSLMVTSLPAGVPFKVTQVSADHGWTAAGTTPLLVTGVPPGRVRVTLSRPGYGDVFQNIDVEAGKTAKTSEIDHRSQPVRIKVAESPARITVDGKVVGGPEVELLTLPPGEHALLLEANGYKAYRTKFTTEQKATPVSLAYSFKQLALENIPCSACSGAGQIARQQRCNNCNGSGRVDCGDCNNGVSGYVMGDYGGGVMGQKMVMCTSCNRKGYFPCTSCTNGTYHWKSTCTTCSGDGKVSKLQLSP